MGWLFNNITAVQWPTKTFIALSQKRPRISLVKDAPITRMQVNVYRSVASLLLGISFFLAIAYEGWSFGIIVWGTMISIAALAVSFMITIADSFR